VTDLLQPTDSYLTLADYILDLLRSNQEELGLKGVYYADRAKIPFTPIACVEPAEKARELNGVPRRVMTTISVAIIVYTTAITTTEINQRENDKLSEDIEELIHRSPTLDGLVIDSLVVSIESAYLARANSIYRASRLLVEARQQVQLPSSF